MRALPGGALVIAALFVSADGPYANRSLFGGPEIDAWTPDRDARLYPGPWPVVAHPPCERWGNMWWSAQNARGPDAPGLGDDGGCFAAALAAVRAHGGVLEHPEGSRAWAAFGLRAPRFGDGWVEDDPAWPEPRAAALRAWVCSVDQARYGHRARKRTWLYYVGSIAPAELDWRRGEPTAWVVSGPGGYSSAERRARGVELLSKGEHAITPQPFADALVALAAGCRGVTS